MTGLPRVSAPVLTAAVEGLPNRLRRKLDDTAATAAGWPVTVEGDRYTVRVDDATTVTLTAAGGVLTSPDQAACSCLLAPNCLHRAAVLARAPVDDGAVPQAAPEAVPPAVPQAVPPAVPAMVEEPLTPSQLTAADQLHQAAVAVLAAGVSGSGVVLRTALLRAAHDARVRGLHRASALGRQVAAHLRAAHEREPQYRLADLTDDLRELIAVTRRLRDPGLDPALTGPLVGTARRAYELRGSLRLYGLCSVPVVTESGYAGVQTYVADRDGRLWTVTDLMPGGEERAAAAGGLPVALGEAAQSHQTLGRGGLAVSGATASATGALGAGQSVRAARASGAGWAEAPLAAHWQTPLAAQVHRAFATLALPVQDRPAGADLVFVAGRVLGAGTGTSGPLVATADGVVLTLTAPSDHASLPYRANLWQVARATGAELRIVGRPDPARRRHVHTLAVASMDLNLPQSWAGHVDLGFDRLTDQHLPTEAAAAPTMPSIVDHLPAGDLALHLVRRHVERAVAGGRAMQALAPADERRLGVARLATGADLLRALTVAAQHRPRDPFGAPADNEAAAFAAAWLAAAVYERAASWAVSEATWLG